MTDRLIEQIDEAATCYPRQHFGDEQEKYHTDLLKRAKMRKKELEEQEYRLRYTGKSHLWWEMIHHLRYM